MNLVDVIVNVSWLLFAWFMIGSGLAFIIAFAFFGIEEKENE